MDLSLDVVVPESQEKEQSNAADDTFQHGCTISAEPVMIAQPDHSAMDI